LASAASVRYLAALPVMSAPSKRVLLVDDDEDILRLVARVLEADGYDVVTTTDGEAALAECEKAPFALILLDLMMPKMDGETFLARLRARFGTEAPPFVVLSASSQRADIARAHGAIGTLEKPFELEDVRELVETLLLRTSRP
jgi:CheY-like chemotaxis protein